MMSLWKTLLLAGAALAGFAGPVLAAGDHQMVIESAIKDYIRPNFHEFAEESALLRMRVKGLCATPSDADLAAGRSQFKVAVLAFSRIEFVRIGPLAVADRMERLLFWPDRKGIALKQVQDALAEKDMSAADAATLKEKSVAMQGLSALEFLLFGSGAEELTGQAGAYRCYYAGAIATLVADLAQTLDMEWADPAGISDAMLHPKPGAVDYRNQTEVLEKLAATLVHGTETIRDQRLKPILGASTGKPRPKAALFWRSEMTVPALAANFAGLAEFFTRAKFPEAIGTENGWIANGANFEFANAARAAAVVTDPLEQALIDPHQAKALNYLVLITGSLDTLLGENLAAALGLSVGFSALDGD